MLSDQTVTLHGSHFHYTERGERSAPAVIMLHGVTGHARTWDDEGAALAGRYRVLALDQRGHGDSAPPPDADFTIATLARDIAAFADVRVGRMMAGTPERFNTLDDVLAYQRASNPRYTEALLRARVKHGVRPLPDGGFTWKYDRGLRDLVRIGKWSDPIDLWPAWRAITCPTLLVRGAESDILTADLATKMTAAQPKARLVDVPGAGHTVPGDQPDIFIKLLREFLDASE
jgi:pimeloyl-ACP methyl ester carboxylesterase